MAKQSDSATARCRELTIDMLEFLVRSAIGQSSRCGSGAPTPRLDPVKICATASAYDAISLGSFEAVWTHFRISVSVSMRSEFFAR